MKHKYLEDLGIKSSSLPWNWNRNDDRSVMWKGERKIYGFDERDTWSLKYTLVLLTYERLMYYRDHAPVELDTYGRAHEYEIDGKVLVVGEIIDMILGGFEDYLSDDSLIKDYDKVAESFKLLGIIMPSLWW